MSTITVSSPVAFTPGCQIVVFSLTPHLPRWVMRWPWQDGDRLIVAWFYRITGRLLPCDNGTFTVTKVMSQTSFEVAR